MSALLHYVTSFKKEIPWTVVEPVRTECRLIPHQIKVERELNGLIQSNRSFDNLSKKAIGIPNTEIDPEAAKERNQCFNKQAKHEEYKIACK